jgi:hypothetical protein
MTEIRLNLMVNYKQSWNHHTEGETCWCKPIKGMLFLVHRNYEWNGTRWHALKEPK